jgi:hypothetical protein
LFGLQRAGEGYRKVRSDTDPRKEGVIAQALHAQHGPGVAGLVLRALGSWRDAVAGMPFPVSNPGEKH